MRTQSSIPLGVGLIGIGNVSAAYIEHMRPFADIIRVVACAGRDVGRAKAKAAELGIATGCSVEDLLRDPAVDIVLNLTNPLAHTEINLQALRAGKHVYCEKPFALDYASGYKVLQEARKRKLHLCCAPDTVLGGGIQTCRKLIDDGAIGKPIAATANMLHGGVEAWHPNPDFCYQPGGGPLFGMGPYYLTALVTLLGPVNRVAASATIGRKERRITSLPFHGQLITVRTPTHLCGVLEHVQGAVSTVTMSYDVAAHQAPMLEIYGTDGSLHCPDPNNFNGDVLLWTTSNPQWVKVPLTHDGSTGRGLGVAEMADAIRHHRLPRASGELGLHVVEVMESFHTSARTGRKVKIHTPCPQPAAMSAAFTLLELLFVIGIILLLVALLIPAIQLVKNSARTAKSMNQVQQLAVALRSYANEDARHLYPTPETLGSTSLLTCDPANPGSTLVLLARSGYVVKQSDIDGEPTSSTYQALLDGWKRPLRYFLDGPYLNGGAFDGHLMNGIADRPAPVSEWNPSGEEPYPYVWSLGRPTRTGDSADAQPGNAANWLFPRGKS